MEGYEILAALNIVAILLVVALIIQARLVFPPVTLTPEFNGIFNQGLQQVERYRDGYFPLAFALRPFFHAL